MPNQLTQYGRKYRILVTGDDGTTALDVSDLRCTFEIVKSIKIPNYSEVVIYNLSPDLEQVIIHAGNRVIVEAGYENGLYGKIFDGDVIQPLWGRENVTDFKLTLHCTVGDELLNNNLVNTTLQGQQYMRDMVSSMAAQARKPVSLGYVSDSVKQIRLPRGKTYFGEAKKYLRDYAIDNSSEFYLANGQAVIMSIKDKSDPGTAFEITPQTGMVGTPIQTQDGVIIRCLLNPKIDLIPSAPMLVKVDQAYIQQQKRQIGIPTSRLDQNGLYKVARVVHTGDTRGDEWYTEITGINSDAQGLLPAMLETAAMTGQ